MQFVVTLISNPTERALTQELAQTVRAILAQAGNHVGDIVWLAPEIACDITFDVGTDQSRCRAFLETRVKERLGQAPIDVAIQRNKARRKTLLVADMDSTIIQQECLDELADFVGLREEISAITRRAMAGQIEFRPALKERVSLLKDLDESVLAEVFADRITLTPGASQLVRTMRRDGAVTCLVSGGFTFFTRKVAESAGFEVQRGNILLSKDGKLIGQVAEPILGRRAKLDTLLELQQRHGLTLQQTMAVGDGANDLDMIMAAGMGVAFHAKQILADAADAKIHHGDLTALLYLQGYRSNEIHSDL